jgi:hypothetical protein
MPAIVLFTLILSGYFGQHRNGLERFPMPERGVLLSERATRTQLKNHVIPSCPIIAAGEARDDVILLLEIDKLGRVMRAEMSLSNPIFRKPALQVAHRLRFRPYFLNGEPVPVDGRITYSFYCSSHGGSVSLAPLE